MEIEDGDPAETPSEEEDLWIYNELDNLKKEDSDILHSKSAWLNDRIIDAAQKLICKTLDADNYQSVLNTQKQIGIPFQPVHQDHIQILHDGGDHWFISFCSSGRVQICDSLRSSLNRSSIKSVHSLYKKVAEPGKVKPTFLRVQRQPDGFNYGPFAIALVAEILDGKSSMEAKFNVQKMKPHLIRCLQEKNLSPFPKVPGN